MQQHQSKKYRPKQFIIESENSSEDSSITNKNCGQGPFEIKNLNAPRQNSNMEAIRIFQQQIQQQQ